MHHKTYARLVHEQNTWCVMIYNGYSSLLARLKQHERQKKVANLATSLKNIFAQNLGGRLINW